MSERDLTKISHWGGNWATYDERVRDTEKHGPLRIQLCQEVRKLLDHLAIVWFLDSGTLLGAYRDGKMIPHDDDFDLAFIGGKTLDDANRRVCELAQQIATMDLPYKCRPVYGYVSKLEFYQPEYGKYQLNADHDFHNVTVDLSALWEDNGIYRHSHNTLEHFSISHDQMFPLGNIKYEDHIYPIPADSKHYLLSMYGYIGHGGVFNPETNRYDEPHRHGAS